MLDDAFRDFLFAVNPVFLPWKVGGKGKETKNFMLDYLSLFRGQRINNNLSTHFVENVTDKLLFNDFDETI